MADISFDSPPLKLTREQERRLQLVQFIGLLELKRLFDKQNLKYTLAFGSLLGAVRHHGFIPWDDDIDVMMPRNDFNRLKEICESELSPDFFLQHPETDKNYTLSIMRFRINNTKLVERAFASWDIHDGIAVDIYPCDHIPDNKLKRFVYKYLSKYLLISTQVICNPPVKRKSLVKRILVAILPLPLRVFSHEKMIQIRDNYLCKYGNNLTNEMIIRARESYDERRIIPMDTFVNRVNVSFEGVEVAIAKNYDYILTKVYGNYMILPPVEERCQHHGILKIDFGRYESNEYIQNILKRYHVTSFLEIL